MYKHYKLCKSTELPFIYLWIILIFLVSLNFNDFYFFLNPIILISGLWFFFFKVNSNSAKITSENFSNVEVLKVNSNTVFSSLYFYLILLSFMGLYTTHGKNLILWFNHFNLNNFTIYITQVFLLISLSLFFLIKVTLKKTNLTKSIDYLFSINNLVILLPYLFYVNTVFTFLFLLELISVILLYKLISSKIWFKNLFKSKQLNNTIPQNYINMIFFQYWVTFFSTIFIVYFYINVFYLYGSSEWFVLQFLNKVDFGAVGANCSNLRLLLSIFLLSIFFKLGLTPLHLFKVEVYKGIPFLSIFFYTTYYFVIFFIFFIFLLADLLGAFISYYYLLLIILLLLGSIYIIILLFDVNFLKAFFTYSTIINTVGFLTAFVSSL